MKATIITLYDQKNYGNRLQNYALQSVLETMGMEVKTISYVDKIFGPQFYLVYLFHKLTGYRFSRDPFYWQHGYLRLKKFVDFNKKYISTKWITSMKEMGKDISDYYVVGSDQVWNVEIYSMDFLKDLFLLTFCEDKKKISFSPSFGISSLPDKWEDFFRSNLLKFHALSAREEAGVNIIEDLTGRKAELLIDPTLMLNADDWIKIAERPAGIDDQNPFALTYFLGDRGQESERLLTELHEKYHLNINHLLDITQPEIYISGPREFIYLFSKAEIILTDSFHACVFAFLFRKPFLVYKRKGKNENMMSRIYTFLNTFHLQRKLADAYSRINGNIFEADYETGYETLKREREKVYRYLRESMDL